MIVESKFRPSWWLRNPHLQTIFASKLRRSQKIDLVPERIELPDGDFLDLLWSQLTDGPIVAIFHGLAGTIESAYANGVIATLEQSGYRPVFMTFRGCGEEPNRLRKTYHSGHTEDIAFLINELRKRFPTTPIHAIGYSLGANALIKYLGESANASAQATPETINGTLTSAIAISPPLVLKEGANRMNRGLSKIYQRYLVGLMRDSHNRKRSLRPELKLDPATTEHNTFWEFDNSFTAPLNGFSDVHAYYDAASSRQYLGSITTPCHVIFSRDDPFFTPQVIPEATELSAAVTFELSATGGHVGFITGSNPLRPDYWLDRRIVELLGVSNVLPK